MLSDKIEEQSKIPLKHGKFQVMVMRPLPRKKNKIMAGGQTLYSTVNSNTSGLGSGLGPMNLTIQRHETQTPIMLTPRDRSSLAS